MGDNGFPALMKAAKRFRPRGKGKEVCWDQLRWSRRADEQEKDLRDLLNVYQLWAHGMFPKGDFEGTIKRVETVCRSRRMEVSLTPPSTLRRGGHEIWKLHRHETWHS